MKGRYRISFWGRRALILGALGGFVAWIWAATGSLAPAGEPLSPRPAGDPPSEAWHEVEGEGKPQVLELVLMHGSANYEKIRTWRGRYTQRFKTPYRPDRLGKQSATGTPTSPVTAEFESVCSFAVDLTRDSCYLAIENGKEKYYATDTGKPVDVRLRRILAERCVLTPEHYLHFEPESRYEHLQPLADHELSARRAVFRDPPARAELSHFSDFVDPRFFFCVAGRQGAWSEFPGFIRGLRSAPTKADLDKTVSVSTAQWNGGVWYRVTFLYPGSKKKPEKEYVYASDAGFNLVRMTAWRKDAPTHAYEWQYKVIDGIYIPSKVSLGYHGLEKNRIFELRECVLNEPIDASQFSLAALGVQEGDLVMDNVEKTAYEFKAGKPEKLAKYGEPPPNPAGEQTGLTGARIALAIATLVVLLALAVFFWLRARRATTP